MLENVKNILGKYLETNYKDSNIQLNDFSFNESMDPNLEEVEAVECTNLHDHKILIYEDDKFNKLKGKFIGFYHFLIGRYGKYNLKK